MGYGISFKSIRLHWTETKPSKVTFNQANQKKSKPDLPDFYHTLFLTKSLVSLVNPHLTRVTRLFTRLLLHG